MSGEIFIAFDGGVAAGGLIVDADGKATMLDGDDVARLNRATAGGVLPAEATGLATEHASAAQAADGLSGLQKSPPRGAW